jgi:hypothetical protein
MEKNTIHIDMEKNTIHIVFLNIIDKKYYTECT